jgi:hypothetical protein
MPMSIPIFRRRRATQLTAAARVVAQRPPVTLTVVRHRAQPAAATIARLTATAVFAYLIALPVPGVSRPVLAPLTALLVAQVSLYQTLRSALRRVGSVVAGVLVAVALSALVGFTWWSLGIVIVLALAVGNALHLGDHILEVPISAMLILSSAGTRAAATGRQLCHGGDRLFLPGLDMIQPGQAPHQDQGDGQRQPDAGVDAQFGHGPHERRLLAHQ